MRRKIIDCSKYLSRLLEAVRKHLSTKTKGCDKCVHWVELLQKLKSEAVYTENMETGFLSRCGVCIDPRHMCRNGLGKEIIRGEETNMGL